MKSRTRTIGVAFSDRNDVSDVDAQGIAIFGTFCRCERLDIAEHAGHAHGRRPPFLLIT